jgi:hypothetical protein
MRRPEFDNYAPSYEELLQDPIRDGFAGSSDFFSYPEAGFDSRLFSA